MLLPSSTERVPLHTSEKSNECIRRKTEQNIARVAAGGPEAISARLQELDQEWDIERCLETMAPTITLTGLCLGATVNKKWLLLPVIVQTFFLQHALQGWCPPIPFLRAMGIRTVEEIDQERYALKALRGDFRSVDSTSERTALEAVRKRW